MTKAPSFEGLIAGVLPRHPAASDCYCSGIVTATVNTTTPNNASAATIAIIVIDVVVVDDFVFRE
jgi:hypothetical protein